jgi:4-diphosphocytidyl-2C-methyl-D-erythritol kinase
VAERLEPRIGALLADLARLCPPGIAPRMTGSGACVFARAHNHEAASEIARQLEQSGWQSWAVRTIARHPLFAMALSATDSAII